MAEKNANILILEDDELTGTILFELLKPTYEVFVANKPSIARKYLEKNTIEILICDFHLPEMDGLTFVEQIKAEMSWVDIIMMSGELKLDRVLKAMKLGAADFLKKPFSRDELVLSIERTINLKNLNDRLLQAENINSLFAEELQKSSEFAMISKSQSMEKVKHVMLKVAQTPDTSVLITGESGTGKELVAKGIHNLSKRNKFYFAAVNTSAIPEALFESEFFGHVKGAFTGAVENKQGWFSKAHKGTLFLDEIGDMPMSLQIKLLRVLEERKYVPVGAQQEMDFDVRIIAATNKNIEDLKQGKDFRLDLFHRLGTIEIFLPPLRERKEDIPLLTNHFLQNFSQKLNKRITHIEPEVIHAFMSYNFPGNIRELRNMIEHAIILSDGNVLRLEHFSYFNKKINSEKSQDFNLEKIEKTTILKALEYSNYNKTHAAKLLNIKWNALHRRLEKYDINLP